MWLNKLYTFSICYWSEQNFHSFQLAKSSSLSLISWPILLPFYVQMYSPCRFNVVFVWFFLIRLLFTFILKNPIGAWSLICLDYQIKQAFIRDINRDTLFAHQTQMPKLNDVYYEHKCMVKYLYLCNLSFFNNTVPLTTGNTDNITACDTCFGCYISRLITSKVKKNLLTRCFIS